MEMTTKQVHDILKVVAWIVFVGLCVEAGAKLVAVTISFFISPEGASNLYKGADFSALFEYSRLHFGIMSLLIILIPAMKAFLFYWVIRITSNLDIARPFSKFNADLILTMSRISLQIGITGFIADSYAGWLEKSDLKIHYEGGEMEYLFLAGILFVIVQVFNKGIELQNESELTI